LLSFANIDLSWISAVKNRQIIIVGRKKTAVYDDTKNDNKVCYYDAGVDYDNHTLFSYQKGNMFSPQLHETEAIERELRHFFHCIKNKTKPKTGLEHILQTTKMLETTNQSILENGKPIYL
jgi:predicted dehydrogenase